MRRIKITVDVIMYGILLYLMSYHAGLGLLLHGIFGCVFFGLFFLHHALNWRWYRSLAKGKYSVCRIVFAAVDILLLADFVILAVSSLQMSGDVFSFSPFITTQSARNLHVLGKSWGFVISAVHLGLHTAALLKKMHEKIKETFFAYAYNLLFVLILAAGIFCFVKSGIWSDMLLLSNVDREFDAMLFYIRHIMMTIALCQAVYLTSEFFGKIKYRKNGGKYFP